MVICQLILSILFLQQLSRFLSVMAEAEVLKVEETSKGVESITSINHKHPLIRRFSPSLLDESGPSSATMVTHAEKTTNAVSSFVSCVHVLTGTCIYFIDANISMDNF